MSEAVKDLVVRLSFQHGDTKSQIAAIKNEIRLLDSGFQAAAAGAGGLSSGMNKTAAQAAKLQSQIALQKQAVDKYGIALQQAQGRLQQAVKRHEEYGQRLDEAKKKQAALKDELNQLEFAMRASKKATGDQTDEYIEMLIRQEDLKESLSEIGDEIKTLESGYARSDKAIASADKSVQSLTIAQNEAIASQGQMERSLAGLNGRLKNHADQLEAAGKALHTYGERAMQAGKAQEGIGKTLSRGSAVIVGAGVAAAGTAIKWESDFAGVRKTVNGTEQDLEALEKALLDMGEVKGASYSDLAGIAENAGQLGIATQNVAAFTGTMADLAVTTNLTADSASSDFAKFANITQMPQSAFERMGSTVVELGNNMATTEADTVSMAMRIAAAGTQAGMTQAQILGVAAGLSSLGLEAEAGGTAFSTAISRMQVAVETGSEDLQAYADVAGMSAQAFAAAFKEDAASAFASFVQGLSSGSQSAIVMLDEMGITEVRMRDALLRASNSGTLLTQSIEMANQAWSSNTALAKEASVRYGTTASRMQMLGNRTQRTAIEFGESLLPVLESGMDAADAIIDRFAALDEEQRKQILTWGAYVAAIGPALTLLGKANQGIGKVASSLGGLMNALSATDTPVKTLIGGVGKLLGPAGIAVLAGALVAGGAAFVDWASGAKAAREAAQGMIDVANEMKQTLAETLYDTGTSDPLARFGLSRDSFSSSAATAQQWLDELTRVWSDGARETNEQVAQFTDAFATASDGIREKIAARGNLLEGLGALDSDTSAKMQADLEQLNAWDAEIEALLKKRQNGLLTDEDQSRLNEVIKLRAELELEYSSGDGSGYEAILGGMQAEIDRLSAQGAEVDATAYGDALNALAEGRSAYMESLNASYDAQHREIMAIEDESVRTAALAELNAQYNAQRLEGEQAYQQAVKEAGTQTWEATGMREQVALIDQLAAMLSSGEVNMTELSEWTKNLDEGKMASMLALVEQLTSSGMSDSELAELGIDADDLLSKIQQIRDLTAGMEGMEGLNSIFGEALPEEVQRVLVGLDMTQAAEDWTAFMEGKDPFEIAGTVTITMNNLEQASIDAWESANSGVELTGPVAKIGIALGTGWQGQLSSAFEEGMVVAYGPDGLKVDVTPEVIASLTGNDLIALDEDGTYHVIITPEVGSPEGINAAQQSMNRQTDMGSPLATAMFSFSSQQAVDNINDALAAVATWQQKIAELEAEGEGTDQAVNIMGGALGNLTSSLEGLSAEDLTNIGGAIANLMAAINSGTLDETTAAEYAAQLQELLNIVAAADQYLGTGNEVSAGIAEGMNQYGWAGDATTLASAIQTAINNALGVASPATTMIPTGSFVAAGIGEGMKQYSFASVAAQVANGILSPFGTLPSEGRAIGANFGQGLYSGLKSKMSSSLALARSYASQITTVFRKAWDEHSPSRVAENLTEMFGAGLEKGMQDWPVISERMLDADLLSVRRGANQVINNETDNRNFSSSATVKVERLEVRDQQDIRALAIEIAGLARQQQRGRGM